jgi:Ankyrin repeats (3 copies)
MKIKFNKITKLILVGSMLIGFGIQSMDLDPNLNKKNKRDDVVFDTKDAKRVKINQQQDIDNSDLQDGDQSQSILARIRNGFTRTNDHIVNAIHYAILRLTIGDKIIPLSATSYLRPSRGSVKRYLDGAYCKGHLGYYTRVFLTRYMSKINSRLADKYFKPSDLDNYFIDAIEKGEIRYMQQMINAGFDINDCSGEYWSGNKALHEAIFGYNKEKEHYDYKNPYKYKDAAYFLIDQKADVNVRDNLGRTPLYLAASFGDDHLIKSLLDAKADPNAQVGPFKNTLLHEAADGRNDNLIRLLLDAKADPTIKNAYEKTPLEVLQARNKCTEKLLQERKSDKEKLSNTPQGK